MRAAKIPIYYLAKYTGFFFVFRKITSNKLRILCYHGVSLHKEYEYFDKLFITRDTFEKRMKYLNKTNYPVITLDKGVKAIKQIELEAEMCGFATLIREALR